MTALQRPLVRYRDIAVERTITRTACRDGVDPGPLITYSEGRASRLSAEYVTDPMLVRTDRHRPRDVREELADARNHLCWHIEDHPHDPLVPRWMRALRKICEAYDDLKDDL